MAQSNSKGSLLAPLECRVCGNSPARTFSVGYRYAVCGACGTINKALTRDEYAALSVTYDPGDFAEDVHQDQLRSLLEVDAKKERLSPILDHLRERHGGIRPLSLLDIGCGMGGYLLAARELGLSVKGIEPSASHSQVGRSQFGLDIANEYFSKETTRSELYDVIVLSHVIEHIWDQRAFIEEAYSRLNPGGVILFATPNASSTIAQLTGRYWSMLRPVDHVGLLTARALKMLAPHGAVVAVWTDEFRWEPFVAIATGLRNFIKPATPRNDHPVEANAPSGTAVSNSFRSSSTRINRNNLLRVVATILSWPIFIFDRRFSMGACLFCEMQKPL